MPLQNQEKVEELKEDSRQLGDTSVTFKAERLLIGRMVHVTLVVKASTVGLLLS